MKRSSLHLLESLPFFSINSLRMFEEIRPRALYQNIQRWVRTGEIVRLKNGLYVTKTYVDRFLHDPMYRELIANQLTTPSYLSLEYVLQKQGLLTEATFPITSVTSKTTRHYENRLGTFEYHHLHSRFYFGFEQHRYGKNLLYEATASKALFDFLYLRLSSLDPHDPSTLEALRVNWSELDLPSFKNLRQTIIKSSVKKLVKMIPMLEEIYHGNTH